MNNRGSLNCEIFYAELRLLIAVNKDLQNTEY